MITDLRTDTEKSQSVKDRFAEMNEPLFKDPVVINKYFQPLQSCAVPAKTCSSPPMKRLRETRRAILAVEGEWGV